MNRSVLTAIIAMALVACCSLAWAAAPRGYISRACGFDLNFNGVPGEPDGDCNRICRGDRTDADIDGNGVADRQVYVNCSAGTDSTTCGSPGSPCRTLQFALDGSNSSFVDRISSPAANQIQALCFQGTCGNARLNLRRSGAAGIYTRQASGSEPRSFEFPRYPLIISGWDVNADGNYPPNSGETAVVDGNVSGNTDTFFGNAGQSRYEVAHFTIRDYGWACTGDVGIGGPGGGGDVSHAYWHDLAIIDVNRGCDQHNPADQGGQILWNIWTGAGNTLRYFAVVNTSIQNWGGYIFRGASPTDLIPTETSGPFRFQNVTATALPANGSPVFGFKPWSRIVGFDLIDSIIDANTAAYSPGDPSSHFAIGVHQCMQDVVIRNNSISNWKAAIILNPAASGYCSSLDLDKITIDGNEIRNTNSSWGRFSGHTGIQVAANDGSSSQVAQNVTITNNFISSTNTGWRTAIFVENSRDSGPITGLLRIAGNTIEANGASCDLGLIGFCTNRGCRSQRQNNIKIQGNVLRGCQTNAAVVDVAYAPSGFVVDWNIYDADSTANWVWNGSAQATLASWRTVLGGCPAANHDCDAKQCAPTYVSAASGNYHLRDTDSCARDGGFTLAGVVDKDIDGDPRPGGTSWDAGADEVGRSTTPPPTTPPTTLPTTPPAPPRLLDVEPAGP